MLDWQAVVDWQKAHPFVAKAAWTCPRCKKVNAPHVDRCDCKETDGNLNS